MEDLVLFCEWCGEELIEGDCPFCGWHCDLWDDPEFNPKRFRKEEEKEENI